MTFQPPDLKDKICCALNAFKFLDGEISDIPFSVLQEETQTDDYECVISENSIVDLYISGEDSARITVKYLFSLYEGWNTSKINEPQSYAHSLTEADFLMRIDDYDTLALLEGLENSRNPVIRHSETGVEFWKTEVHLSGSQYHVCLFKGVCLYHLLVEESGNFDKFFPAFSEQDYFVRITCDTGLDMSIADALAASFVFELQATHNLLLQFSEGRPDPGYTYYEDGELTKQSYSIFPLLHGDGIKELLELYSRAKDAIDSDYKILGFTKVIEYIAPTISKEKLYAEVKMQLSLPSVFSPTAKFISDLGEIYRKHQNDSGKDLELIRLAVLTTVDLNDIWDLIPNFVKSSKIVGIDSLDEDAKVNLLNAIVDAIYDTRNEIAHAKANYVKKGKECPPKSKVQFSQMLDKIAVRCIRWFSMQPEDKRVIS